MGIYAGSHNSYKTFAEIFDNIILDYHKYGKSSVHITDMDAKRLNIDSSLFDD